MSSDSCTQHRVARERVRYSRRKATTEGKGREGKGRGWLDLEGKRGEERRGEERGGAASMHRGGLLYDGRVFEGICGQSGFQLAHQFPEAAVLTYMHTIHT